ncbi:MAG: hypothetical protein STSR0008_21720 [Ignavibacterium sp.]
MKHLLLKPGLTRLPFFLGAMLFTLLIIPQIFAQGSDKAVNLDGVNDYINVTDAASLDFGTNPFTLEAWVKPAENIDAETDQLGDIVTKFDQSNKQGFNLSFLRQSSSGSQSNNRNLFFGIDNNRSDAAWIQKAPKAGDTEIYIRSLAVYNGKLYGGTAPNSKLYEWNGTDAWVEKAPKLGVETFILSLAVYNGKLYGGTNPNGKLYEWNGTDAWVEKASTLGAETQINSLAVYNGKLYGGTGNNGKLYEWNGTDAWVEKASTLGAETSIRSLAVYNDKLYGGTYPNGKLYEWNDIDAWVEKASTLGTATMIYSLAVYNGKLYGGTGQNGRLYEWNGTDAWVEKAPQAGGTEQRIYSLAVYNGKLYGGTGGNGRLYEWNGTDAWVEKAPKLGAETFIWSLAVYNGKLYGGTANNGRLYEWKTGVSVSYDYQFPNRWQHVAAVRDATSLKMYVNGVLVKTSDAFTQSDYDLSNTNDLLVGFGQQDYFKGTIDEVRIWSDVRTQDEIQANMCKKLTGSEANLVGYWRLDDGSGITAADASGNGNTGTLTNGPNWGWSGAAIGDASAYDYTGTNPSDFSVNITHLDGDDITATGDGGTVSGIQVYRVDETSMRDGATAPTNWTMDPFRYWGVFIAGTSPTYSLSYNYDGHPGITDESDLDLATRDNLSGDSWADANATLDQALNTLTLTGQTGTEYALGSQTSVNPLPVELTSFTSNILSSGVELKWQTATEVNNYGFDVERSTDKQNWTNLGFVAGNGNSNSPKDYSYVDEDIKNQVNGKYYYHLKQIDTDGSYEYSETIEVDWTKGVTDVNDSKSLPNEFALSQNYPNPFNPTTKIKYTITASPISSPKERTFVRLIVYDVLGNEIATLVNEEKAPGEYEVEFNGKGLSSGMYFYKIEAGNFVQIKKMILLK